MGSGVAIKPSVESQELTKIDSLDTDHLHLPSHPKISHNVPSTTPNSTSGFSQISQNEIWRRLINDPLLAILKQEHIQRKTLQSNHTIMHKLKNEITTLKGDTSKIKKDRHRRLDRKEQRKTNFT